MSWPRGWEGQRSSVSGTSPPARPWSPFLSLPSLDILVLCLCLLQRPGQASEHHRRRASTPGKSTGQVCPPSSVLPWEAPLEQNYDLKVICLHRSPQSPFSDLPPPTSRSPHHLRTWGLHKSNGCVFHRTYELDAILPGPSRVPAGPKA